MASFTVQPTLIRVKRKRTEQPLDVLFIENEIEANDLLLPFSSLLTKNSDTTVEQPAIVGDLFGALVFIGDYCLLYFSITVE